MVRNNVRWASKGYALVEGLYFDEPFSPVVRLEAINFFGIFESYKFHGISDGCEINFLEWWNWGRGLHWKTWIFLAIKKF